MGLKIVCPLLLIAAVLVGGCDRNAAAQNRARQLARQVDLPAITVADRVVITSAPPPRGTGQRATISDAARIQQLHQALTVHQTPPSSGMETVILRFYQGDTLLREVWVYADGEWGFRHPGTSWTAGRNPRLIQLVQQELGPMPGGE